MLTNIPKAFDPYDAVREELRAESGTVMNIPIPETSFDLGYGASKSQDLGVTPKKVQEIPSHPGYYSEGIYTLNFSVQNQFANYPGYYVAELSFGSQELGETAGWGTGAVSQVTVSWPGSVYILIDKSLNCDQNPCTSGPEGSAQGDSDLVLDVTVLGWTMKISNISLTFTPSN